MLGYSYMFQALVDINKNNIYQFDFGLLNILLKEMSSIKIFCEKQIII